MLVIPPPPLIKVASNTRPYSKLGGTTLNEREEGGQYYIIQTCDQERFEARKVVFPWECLIIFATGCSSPVAFFFCTVQFPLQKCPLQHDNLCFLFGNKFLSFTHFFLQVRNSLIMLFPSHIQLFPNFLTGASHSFLQGDPVLPMKIKK